MYMKSLKLASLYMSLNFVSVSTVYAACLYVCSIAPEDSPFSI